MVLTRIHNLSGLVFFKSSQKNTSCLETESPEGKNLLEVENSDWTEPGQVGVTQVDSVRKMLTKNLGDCRHQSLEEKNRF